MAFINPSASATEESFNFTSQAAPCGSSFSFSGAVVSSFVHLDHFARYRRINIGDRLHRFDGAEALALLDLAPIFGRST